MLKSIGVIIGVSAFALGILLTILFSGGSTNVENENTNSNENLNSILNELNMSSTQIIIINNTLVDSD